MRPIARFLVAIHLDSVQIETVNLGRFMVYVYSLFLVVVSRESVRRWFLKAGEILSRDGVGGRGL